MWKPAALCLCTAVIALSAVAQDAAQEVQPVLLETPLPAFELDGGFAYAARTTQEFLDREASDNDIMRFTLGATWRYDLNQARLALELGARNEDFSSSYPAMAGGELGYHWLQDWGRFGLGARARWADDLETTGELAFGAERFGDTIDLRGMAGVQYVTDTDDLADRTQTSAFGLGEATWFPIDNLALWLGVMGDADGSVGGVGVEIRPRRWPVSFFMEWGHALTEYRGLNGYNDLYGGIKFVPRSRTLKEHRRAVTDRSFLRYVEVQ